MYVNWSAADVALVPLAVVTRTCTVPAAPAGEVAAMVVDDVTENVAAAPPKVTPDAPVKPVPVIVTGVPPAVLPVAGDSCVTVGGVELP